MKSSKNLPLSELLRPQTLADLAVQTEIRKRFQKMMDEKNVMNMIFYGSPGTGKSTAARILGGWNNSSLSLMISNGSQASGVDFVRHGLAGFATSVSLDGAAHKLCVIDEADQLSDPAQQSLRGLIDRVYSNCRFILTTNHRTRIDQALQSRLEAICFDPQSSSQDQVVLDYTTRLFAKLLQLKIAFEEDRVRQLISRRFPDFRSIANRVEFEYQQLSVQ